MAIARNRKGEGPGEDFRAELLILLFGGNFSALCTGRVVVVVEATIVDPAGIGN